MTDHIHTDDATAVVATSKDALLQRARRLAGPARDHHEAHQESIAQRNQAIIELDDAGVPVAEIARELALSRTQVYRIIEAEHLRRRAELPANIADQPDADAVA